jgi:hypothetical protein
MPRTVKDIMVFDFKMKSGRFLSYICSLYSVEKHIRELGMSIGAHLYSQHTGAEAR